MDGSCFTSVWYRHCLSVDLLIVQLSFSSRAFVHSLRSLLKAQLILPAMDRLNGFFRRDSAKKAFEVTIESVPETQTPRLGHWKPVTLRRPFLSAVVLVTLGLLALVQVLVIYDQRHDGILFATKISQLGAGYTFLYRYLPTIISVSYGLIWHWVDIDARRVEPYRQLSKPGGASGSQSLLLHYPTDLLAFVPLKALKQKHWPVVLASSALVLVGMGLTPLQAAIFATEKVTRTFDEPMLLSTSHMSLSDQALQITANYTYSVANIVWLDERLPAFMTRDAAFAPFKLETSRMPHANETWTAETMSYGVDVTCESAMLDSDGRWSSSQGCHVPDSIGPGADVIGVDESGDVLKQYTPFFAGFSGNGGNVNYYLEPYCPENASHVFMIALRQNRESANDPPAPMTRLFCETRYHQHSVTATIHRVGGSVVNFTAGGPEAPLSPELFNTSIFEDQISNAVQQNKVRGVLPSSAWPDQRPQLAKLPLTVSDSFQEMTNIFGLAVGAYHRDFDDYMDPRVLTTAVQAAHRLLFARAMVDVLADDYRTTDSIDGTRVYNTEAVRVVKRFAYAVEAVLGIVALMAGTMIAVTWCDVINLRTDPDSLSALMLLVKGQPAILEQFSQHDQSSWALLKAETSDSTYMLGQPHTTQQGTLKLRNSPIDVDNVKNRDSKEDTPDFNYPIEFSMVTGVLFVFLLLSTLAATCVLFQTSKGHGLALPTQNRLVRQLLQNYIPTVIATLIEPVWVVLNRLLCLFQPFEALHGKRVSAKRSINLKYSSLPPQLVFFKALRARHFTLSAICAMTVLANVLAVAFSGLINEDTRAVAHQAKGFSVYDARLKDHIKNSTDYGNPVDPSPFYYTMANSTSDTPMPLWTDDSAFYLPVSHEVQLNSSDQLRLSGVSALALNMQCDPIGSAHGSSWSFGKGAFANNSAVRTNMTVSLTDGRGAPLVCATKSLFLTRDIYPWLCSSQEVFAVEYMAPLMAPEFSKEPKPPASDDACQGLLVGVWARRRASQMCDDDAFTLSEDEATAMICRTKVTIQPVNLTTTGDHLVLKAESEELFSGFSGSDKLIEEASNAMWQLETYDNSVLYHGGTWHNDSFPSDWHSYTMNLIDPDSGILNPALPPPDFNQTAALFAKSYQKLFAIWLGLNHDRVLAETSGDNPAIEATILRPEIRIVVSKPMVLLSSTILGLYIIVAIAVYARRPGRFLPRIPLTMASDIALFAASKAVTEIEEKERFGQEPGADRTRFGYGSFIGTDGRPHVGVERAPFVVSA
jgi:hypothetical protein